ncbi:MAG: hypothetical protein ACK4MF_02170 [Hyphomicrobiaceae bacterium]
MNQRQPLAVAITGHRPNRMHIGQAAVARRLCWVLAALGAGARQADDGRPVAVSALAEGSDRMFAAAALDLDYDLRVLLPFASPDYETTFGDPATTAVYRDLLARAQTIRQLPGDLADSKAAYEAVGRATVEAACILVTVWDGKGAAGRGGTPEIIAYALARAMPVIWIDAAHRRLPLLISMPTPSGAQTDSLTLLARSARPLGRDHVQALARSVVRQT